MQINNMIGSGKGKSYQWGLWRSMGKTIFSSESVTGDMMTMVIKNNKSFAIDL